jgi:hypothetical protein
MQKEGRGYPSIYLINYTKFVAPANRKFTCIIDDFKNKSLFQ